MALTRGSGFDADTARGVGIGGSLPWERCVKEMRK